MTAWKRQSDSGASAAAPRYCEATQVWIARPGAANPGFVFKTMQRSEVEVPEAGIGLELDVITAVVVGGTSIYGGRGRILGTLLGVILIHETRQFVDWHWQRSELTLIVIGTVLILSLLGHRLLLPRKER